jgi:hypothetical protein
MIDAVLEWLRTPTVTPTVSRAEVLFTPFIVVAFGFHLRNVVVMYRLWARMRQIPEDADLAASAHQRGRRSLRALLRVGCWLLICWALLVNWVYTQVVFTLGALGYAILEAADAVLDWIYEQGRARYWRERERLEDYAEQVAGLAAAAAQKAEAAVIAAREEAKVDVAAVMDEVKENRALTEQAAQSADKKLDDLAATAATTQHTSEKIHTLTNSAYTAQLRISATLARRLAAVTDDPGDVEAAEAAEATLAEHTKGQEATPP